MVEKRPKFTGPLVNSWPARLLTLEIARFSLISWDPKKCRNHYFCSIISFALTRPLKMDPQKRGSKNKTVDRAVSKKPPPPPPARLLTLPFGDIKNQGKNSVFRFSRSRFLAHFFFLFLVLFAPEKLSAKFLPRFEGCQKTGENKVFFFFSGVVPFFFQF